MIPNKLGKEIRLFALLVSLVLSACTDYAQKIQDKFEPEDASTAPTEEGPNTEDYIYETFVDYRDGREYKVVRIDMLYWMAENLNYVGLGRCYDDKKSLCEKYGRLYTWEEARIACPDGWHLPSKYEMESLIDMAGGTGILADMLKSTTGWSDGGNGFDAFHFSALPAGMFGPDGEFDGYEETTGFWSSTPGTRDTLGYYLIMRYDNSEARLNQGSINYGFSVRCIEGIEIEDESSSSMEDEWSSSSSDEEESSSSEVESSSSVTFYPDEELVDDRDGQVYRTVTIESQTWMAQNLNYETENSRCYNDEESSCDTYGRLYKWQDAQIACPYGWHLPSKEDFDTLITVAGGYEIAGKTLKSTTGWWDTGKGEGGTDDFGFTVLPAGSTNINEAFINRTVIALFWTSSVSWDDVYLLRFENSVDEASMFLGDMKYAFSVRCIKD